MPAPPDDRMASHRSLLRDATTTARSAAVAALFLVACDAAPPAVPGAVARFEPDGTPLDFAAVPFPSDLYLDGDGGLALGDVPSVRTGEPFFEALRGLLAERDGFSSTGALHFGIDGVLDPASLPGLAGPGDAARIEDGVLLLDADDTSATEGALVPLRVYYDARRGLLTARPARGRTLGPGHRWVAALTTALRGEDGAPLAPSAAFTAVRDGADRRFPAIDDALAALEAAGVARASVVSATAFTTERPGAALVELRAGVHAAPAPAIAVDRVIPGPDGTIDDFFGVPAEARPGVDVASADVPGERALVHETVAHVVLGRFTAPRVVTGAGTDVGTPLRDAAGALTTGALEDVPFVLVVPTGADVSSLPVLVVHHGFNASRVTALVLADTAGRAGMAVLGIDAFQHGARAAGAVDEVHDLRGAPGSDGLYETSVASVSARTFGIVGPPAGMELFPAYAEGAFLQFAADVMSAVRLVREGDPAPLRASDAALASLAFDPERIAYLGISMGSVVGASVLAAEPDVRALVLCVPPGGVVDTLCEGAEFRALATGTLANLLGIRGGPFDEVSRSCANDPVVDLFRWAMEPVDPLALAPHFFGAPLVPGARPDVLWLLASHDQLAAPPAAEAMLAVAGAPGVGAFAFAPLPAAELPARANLPTPAGAVTAVAARCEPCSHGLPEVRGGTSDYEAPLDPPFVRRPAELTFDNPIEATHARITRFLEGVVARERAVVE